MSGSKAERSDSEIPAGSAVLRAVRILEVIAACDDAPQLAEICRAVDLPKATVYRILATLEHAGYVAKEPGTKQYGCGHRLHQLSGRVLLSSPMRASRHAILEELVEQVGETCNLAVPSLNSVLYLDRVEAAWPLRVSLGAGSNVPLYASACGKIFLSSMSKRARERFVRSTPLVGYTSRTFIEPGRLLAELESIRAAGFAVDDEEYLQGICCVAVPVRSRRRGRGRRGCGSRPGVANVADAGTQFLPQLRDAADAVGRTLEW
ncbi:MAG: IclR family transcriptional regulator [Burkholderiaceae bacterium]